MWSSTILLSLSSVFGIIGLALVLAAALTDNWTEYQVNRREVINAFNREPELNVRLKDAFVRNVNYFSRNYGLFQICFPDSVPSDIGSFSKYGSPCIDNTDYFPAEAVQENYSSQQTQRLYFMRANVATYVLGLGVVVVCLAIAGIGCARQSRKAFMFTGVGLLLTVLLFAVSMACWHYVNYLERAVLEMPPFYKSWEPILKSTTRFNFGWSLVVAWVGILFILFASVFFICSASRLKV
ncbi:hypothetical protein OESDEN_00306 [Oesophagostomum dentatum]|uniref:Uncharacterized protein n=1 Tax=Oesophagostomum dentatum TaxID=61180 RepID=A0A0B1TR34_OESDE|nr:hypothetical protein OESDEN_00306 [Oesophagostomum dentatum]